MFELPRQKVQPLQHVKNFSGINNEWLAIKRVNSQQELTEQYSHICQQHAVEKKWILMIDPQDISLEQLASVGNIDPSKILQLDSSKVKVELINIESALTRGNYSAVILGNSHLKKEQLIQLTACAKKGQTRCVVIKGGEQLH